MRLRGENIIITPDRFDPEVELAGFRRWPQCAGAGAIVSFTGLVRGEADGLTLSHYPGFTELQIEKMAQQAMQRWSLLGYKIIHRIGDMRPQDPIVFIAAASPHRRAAFEAVDFIMDYLKSQAAFWKQETRGGETRWIEPRCEDMRDLKRWSK